MFGIIFVNIDAGSYLHMAPEKALAKANKDKKYLYPQACLECRCSFTQTFYSMDRISRAGSLVSQRILAALLIFKLKR